MDTIKKTAILENLKRYLEILDKKLKEIEKYSYYIRGPSKIFNSDEEMEEVMSKFFKELKDKNLIKNLQSFYVESIETYFMFYYICLQRFALTLNAFGLSEFRNHTPTGHMTKFIKLLTGKFENNSEITNLLKIIKNSISYRSKVISHPETRAPNYFYTYTLQRKEAAEKELFLIYYVPKTSSNQMGKGGNIDPKDPSYKTIFDSEKHTLVPQINDAHHALLKLISYSLDKFI